MEPDHDRLAAFVRETQPRTGANVTGCASAREAVDGADIVVLATSAREPVVRSEWIADGTHICAVGACRPDQREMDTALVARARLFVDSRSGALAEAGDVLLPMPEGAFDETHIAGELGEVSSGTVPGRRSATEVTIFSLWGWPWKTSRPRTWPTRRRRSAAWAAASCCNFSCQLTADS